MEKIQWKFMNFFFKFKTPYFWPISPIFGVKKFFQKIRFCYTQLDKGF